jgi:hypothetical protein
VPDLQSMKVFDLRDRQINNQSLFRQFLEGPIVLLPNFF